MEEKILSAFLYSKKLKFSEIEKFVKTRSNKLAYHLKKLENQGILIKEKEFYYLSEFAQKIIPYLSSKQSALPVILIAIKNKKKIHSFLLIFVTATTKDKINYSTLNKKEMIASDYELIKNNLDKEIKINTFLTKL